MVSLLVSLQNPFPFLFRYPLPIAYAAHYFKSIYSFKQSVEFTLNLKLNLHLDLEAIHKHLLIIYYLLLLF